MNEEIQALKKNETWEIIDLPPNKNPIGCKWVFTLKYKQDASVDRFKARIIAKGFTQSYVIDYQDTFALLQNSIQLESSSVAKGYFQSQADHNLFVKHTQ